MLYCLTKPILGFILTTCRNKSLKYLFVKGIKRTSCYTIIIFACNINYDSRELLKHVLEIDIPTVTEGITKNSTALVRVGVGYTYVAWFMLRIA